MTKKELRRIYSDKRRRASCREADERITERLLSMKEILEADTVLLYASFGSEPSTWGLASELIEKGIDIAYPKCGENGEMVYYRVSSTDELHIGKFGIAEPEGCIIDIPNITEKTVCIVPALAFSLKGDRIGHGGGYYDRFLEICPDLYTIGITYEACLADKLETAEHDQKVKAIVTEERMVLCNE